MPVLSRWPTPRTSTRGSRWSWGWRGGHRSCTCLTSSAVMPGGLGGTLNSFLAMGLEYSVMDPFTSEQDRYLGMFSVFQVNTRLSLAFCVYVKVVLFFASIQVVPGPSVTNKKNEVFTTLASIICHLWIIPHAAGCRTGRKQVKCTDYGQTLARLVF